MCRTVVSCIVPKVFPTLRIVEVEPPLLEVMKLNRKKIRYIVRMKEQESVLMYDQECRECKHFDEERQECRLDTCKNLKFYIAASGMGEL